MSDKPANNRPALLLLGPTGSGKSPMGEYLAQHGLLGRRCYHFDFGANLRATVESGPGPLFEATEIDFLKRVLNEGLLLEDSAFGIAEKILRQFLSDKNAGSDDWIVLNGLPRHVGQARAVQPVLDVRIVALLECKAAVVRQRLRSNIGGDRGTREDDDTVLVTRKLALFEERTRPLVDFYKEQGATIARISVGANSTSAEMSMMLAAWLASTSVR